MKKRINLFSFKEKKEWQEKISRKIRQSATLISLILFISFLSVNLLNIFQKNKLRKINLEKQDYLSYLIESKENEAKLKIFNIKENQLTTFLKDDAKFLPYYTILKEAIYQSTQSAKIDNISIDKERNCQFSVGFDSYAEMVNFLNYIETKTFLDHFNNLFLMNFDLNEDKKNKSINNYQLVFKGKFNYINEEEN
ncbi:MAG: hypothetical protein QHH09_03690 [Microgenomates group bacterium]|nr:hypothetical protein [Microgenomates group bacterium]